MSALPSFEAVAIVGNKPSLVAEISSLFKRPGRYLTVIDGPRMSRPDRDNEVIRRSNALVMTECRRVIVADLPIETTQCLSQEWPGGTFIPVTSAQEAQTALKGWTKSPCDKMLWGSNNLGVGLLLARRSKKYLQTTEGASPTTSFVPNDAPLLIACEAGNELAQVIAGNLAFATNANFLVIPNLGDEERDGWLEEIYAIGSNGNVSERFGDIRDRVRCRLPNVEFGIYKQLLFITNGFPWGIAVPECAATHMFAYPDFWRSIVEGLWVSHDPTRSARTALLIQPERKVGSEIEYIAESLNKNRTLVRVQSGPRATVNNVNMLIETLPFDIIVISTHASDVAGERATYQFKDSEGVSRRLVIDHGVGFGYDPKTEKVLVQQFHRFHELDGVDWMDSSAKAQLYIGTAITSWLALGDITERNKFKVASETIDRVRGSMGLKMYDGVWITMIQGFPPRCAPIVINNACASWHQLSKRFTFAGARAYIGALFPVTEIEAQEIGTSIFQKELGRLLPNALWVSQNAVYGDQARRPYAMVGLPFCSIRLNTIDSVAYFSEGCTKAIAEYGRKAEESSFPDVKENSIRFKEFLIEESRAFAQLFKL